MSIKNWLFFLFSLFVTLRAENTTYLIDCDLTYDIFKLQVRETNLEILNQGFTNLEPGDRILFKCSETFTGNLFVENQSGTETNPISIDSYVEENGQIFPSISSNKPIIIYNSDDPDNYVDSGYKALYFKNSQCFEISNIEIQNSGGGIAFLFFDEIDFNHIYINGCDFLDIKGTAIMVVNPSKGWNPDYKNCKGNDIDISNNNLNECGSVGIYTYQGWCNDSTTWVENNEYQKSWFTNIKIIKLINLFN